MLKTLIILFLAVPPISIVVGQPPGGQAAPVNSGVFYGKILDAGTQKAIEGATVQLVQNRFDTLTGKKYELVLSTQLSDKKGEFNIDKLPVAGTFKLKLSCVGYKPFDIKVSFDPSGQPHSIIKDLGNFKLFADAEQLETITVNGNKPLLQLYPDKRVYNVEKDLNAAGGTAADVVRNIPGIITDIDGNISIRNASPQVFIDGRPTTLTLDQVPADQIATIELMTNPSAKYDAGTSGGILNVVLKKNKRSGYNGNLRASVDSRYMPGMGGDINIKQNKINFFAAAQLNRRKNISDNISDRTDYPVNAVAITSQNSHPVVKGLFGFGRAGFDFLMTNRTTLTLSGNYSKGNLTVTDLLNIDKDTIYPSTTVSEKVLRNLGADIEFSNKGANIGIKHNFAEPGKEWTADVSYNRNRNTNTSDYLSRRYDNMGSPLPASGAERATGGGNTSFYVFQTDFTNPMSSATKFEAGARVVYRDYNSWNDNFRQEPPSLLYTQLPSTTVNFSFNDVVYAAYGTYSQKIDKFSYHLGLRAERSEYKGNLINKNQRFSNAYPVSLFPSVFLTQAINTKQELQLNYSRKINRPGFFHILPFVDFSDSLNLSVGNPDIKPEFTHMAELSYTNNFSQQHSLMLSLYGRYTDGLITRYQYKAPNTDPSHTDSVIYNSFANADKSYIYGAELTLKNKVAEWWDITSNINVYNAEVKASNLSGIGNNELASWFAKMNHSFKLPYKFSLQLSGDYQAKTILPAVGRNSQGSIIGSINSLSQNFVQGYIRPLYGADIALRKDLFKNNSASITLQVNDIFKTRNFETYTSTIFFTQENYRLRDPQVFRLNFTWRFGKFDAALFKRKNNKNDLDNIPLQGVGQ